MCSRIDIYDADTGSWSTAELNHAIINVTAIAFQGKAYFSGAPYGVRYRVPVQIYNLSGNVWSGIELTAAKSWVPIGHTHNKIVFVGGESSSTNTSRKIEIYNPISGDWSIEWMGLDLGYQSILSYNGTIYSAGGVVNGGDNTVAGIYKLRF